MLGYTSWLKFERVAFNAERSTVGHLSWLEFNSVVSTVGRSIMGKASRIDDARSIS